MVNSTADNYIGQTKKNTVRTMEKDEIAKKRVAEAADLETEKSADAETHVAKKIMTGAEKDINEKSAVVTTNSTESQKETTPFVFGSTTPFGKMGGFKMFGAEKSTFSKHSTKEKKLDCSGNDKEQSSKTKDGNEDSIKKDEDTNTNNEADDDTAKGADTDSQVSKDTTTMTPAPSAQTKPAKSIFGSGSTFGNAFQAAISKESIFESIAENSKSGSKESETDTGETKQSDENVKTDVYKTVHLEKQEVKSGEENEECIFQIKAKLYHMEIAGAASGWKERGFGVIKVNKFIKSPAENYTSRIIMRQNGNFKLILNVPIVRGFKLLKGMPSSLAGDKFIRLQLIENGVPVQFAIKVGLPENAQKLYDAIDGQIPA
jgi:Ran-binding protein 3